MKKLTFKIIFYLMLVFFLSTLIPRIIIDFSENFPGREILVADGVFIAIFVSVGLSLALFAFILHRMIVRRIKHLDDATSKIKQGDLDIVIPVEGKDELAGLSNNFNLMVEALKDNAFLNKTFIQNVSHEIKTPIAAIKGYSDLIYLGDSDDETIKKYACIISRESARLNQLSKNMLELSAIESTTLIKQNDAVNIGEQIRNILQLLQLDWEEKNLVFDLDLSDIKFKTNKAFTYQIFKNLIENAIFYTPNEHTIEIKLTQTDDALQFYIKNEGTGLSESEQTKIFDAFYTGKNKSERSSGIGLSIVKTALKKLSGTITVESDESTYVAFNVMIPVVEYRKN